jgi:hypothetical protein
MDWSSVARSWVHSTTSSARASSPFKECATLIVQTACTREHIEQRLDWDRLPIGALAAASGSKRMRELGEREHTPAGVLLDRLFADTTEEAQIVLPDGPITAAVAERADPAVVVQ